MKEQLSKLLDILVEHNYLKHSYIASNQSKNKRSTDTYFLNDSIKEEVLKDE